MIVKTIQAVFKRSSLTSEIYAEKNQLISRLELFKFENSFETPCMPITLVVYRFL
jgi:hypothetical protein